MCNVIQSNSTLLGGNFFLSALIKYTFIHIKILYCAGLMLPLAAVWPNVVHCWLLLAVLFVPLLGYTM